MTRISSSAFEFPAPEPSSELSETALSADFNNAPIHIWVSQSSATQISGIRVTGHAVAWVCAQASLTLQEFLADSATVSGFLSYGVGEMRPASQAMRAAFSEKAKALITTLEAIDRDHAEELQVHRVADFSDELPLPTASERAERSFSVKRMRLAEYGPAFIPVRRWERGGSPSPVTFTLRSSDLGATTNLIAELSRDAGVAPIAELIDKSRNRIARIISLQNWRREGRPMDDDLYGFMQKRELYSPTLEELETATTTMRSFVRKYDALAFLLPNATEHFQRPKIRQKVRGVEQAIVLNELCRFRLTRGRTCELFFSAERRPPETKSEKENAETLTQMMKLIDALPDEVFERAIASQEVEIQNLQRLLVIQKQPSAARIAQNRETTLDGMLRGWPASSSNEQLTEKLDSALATDIPKLWDTLLTSYATTRSAELRQDARVAGVLERANVFYRVKQTSVGVYDVTPTYVVLGRYLEVWDPIRHRVTIEQEGSDNQLPDLVQEG